MQLILSTEDFTIHGVSYPGFPLVVDKKMELQEEVFDFLVNQCITRGRVQSLESWKAYGQSMYDYFGFLEANKWDWKNISVKRDSTILATYRDWSISKMSLSPTTVNYRLRVIIKFYQHALKREWIDKLPYELEDVFVKQPKGFLAHTDTKGSIKATPNIMLKQQATQVDVLSRSQIEVFLAAIKNPTQFMIARLGLQTGLRKMELCSFPLKYLKDAQTLRGMRSHISINLDPSDMNLKGNKPRTIDVPAGLMSDLWQYAIHERNALEQKQGTKQKELFLNDNGIAYKATSLNNLWKRLSLPFKVTPHILRHTYATHTLYELQKKKSSGVNPLMYVRDRLGHSSINTTQKYLHFINQVDDDLMTRYQKEIDKMSVGLGHGKKEV